jgi:CheY-like chemotaxis protein
MSVSREDLKPMSRVLVIDDQSHVRAAMVFGLESEGFEAVAVASGAAGLRALEVSKFDLIIVDIYMPGIDGVQLIKVIRANDPSAKIIAMSGVQMPISGRTALDFFPLVPHMLGIVRLQKPFRSSELLQAILKANALAKAKTVVEPTP